MSSVEDLVRAGVEKRAESIRALDVHYRDYQRERLFSILRQNKETEFGRAHGFSGITSIEEYQRAVPPSEAEDYQAAWRRIGEGERDVLFSDPVHAFGLSSGTTGDPKLIPIAKGLIRTLKHAIGYATSSYMATTGDYSLLRGYALQMAAPTCVRRLAGNLPVGYITGIIGASRTYPFHQIGLPPIDVIDLPDWEEKYRIVAERYADHDVRMIFGVPTYILGLVRHMREREGGRGGAPIWPDLSLIVTSGVSVAPHRAELLRAFPKAQFREMYLATEGAIGFQAEPEGGLIPMAEDIFLEFVPENRWGEADAPRLLLGETEPGVDYVPLLTTPSGLYAYTPGDQVRFLQRDPPRFAVGGRRGNVLSLATEKLDAHQAERVLAEAGLVCEGYLVCPREEGVLGHEWVIEYRATAPPDAAAQIDLILRRINPLYNQLREGRGLLAPALVSVAPKGTFRRALARRPGQGKILSIYRDREVRDELMAPPA